MEFLRLLYLWGRIEFLGSVAVCHLPVEFSCPIIHSKLSTQQEAEKLIKKNTIAITKPLEKEQIVEEKRGGER